MLTLMLVMKKLVRRGERPVFALTLEAYGVGVLSGLALELWKLYSRVGA